MGIEGIAVAADAGPLIHLHEINMLSLLENFAELHIPDAVWEESTHHERIPATMLECLPNLVRHRLASDDCLYAQALRHLQAGEKECLCLCGQLQVSVVLTDDLAAREAATKRGLTPVGSVGVIAKCCFARKIMPAQAENALLQLYENSSLFVTKAIVESAIETLRRHNEAN
ncbi:MAG: hypothetical protein GY862_28990 [Gammaproteobacteria bacterium]|nr:hypothetical protein [Gammaproteobacteria bacterium]